MGRRTPLYPIPLIHFGGKDMNNNESAFMPGHIAYVDSVVPKPSNPIYIVTPPYTRVSAGVTVLHLLCHYLNIAGHIAYLVHYPPQQVPVRSLPAYVTLQGSNEHPGGMVAPLITHDIIEYYDSLRLTPIVIYPEVFDNPLQASFFGRYILNYPGKLSTKYQEREDFNFSYTRILADHITREYPDHHPVNDVLFVPTSDLSFWNTSGAASSRSGSCFYAGKMKAIHGRQPDNVPTSSVEILRSEQMSREQIRELFWASEAFYCYEDTALAIEAQLCGCPTVFVRNDLFSGRGLASIELGAAGSCISDEPDGLVRAKSTVGEFESVVRAHIGGAAASIAALGRKWRNMVADRPYQGTIRYPYEPRLVLFDRNLPPLGQHAHDDGLSDATFIAHRRGVVGRIAFMARVLTVETLRASGIRGTIKRAARGLLRHGPRGFLVLLYRAGTNPWPR